MSIDISGGMIVGEKGSLLNHLGVEDLNEWAEDNGMETMPEYYDCDTDFCFFGFSVKNVLVSEVNDKWLEELKNKAKKFENLTGIPARLIGTQKVW